MSISLRRMCFRKEYSHRYLLTVSRYTWLFKDVLQNETFPYLSPSTSISLRRMCFRMTYSHRYQLPVSRYTWLFKVDVLQNEIFPYLAAAKSITLRWMCCRMKYSQRYQLAMLLPCVQLCLSFQGGCASE